MSHGKIKSPSNNTRDCSFGCLGYAIATDDELLIWLTGTRQMIPVVDDSNLLRPAKTIL